MRKDSSFPDHDFSNPEDMWLTIKNGLKEKADHNKIEAQACFVAALFLSLLIPLFIAFGDGTVLGKIVPSAMSAMVAGCTGWLQLRKPQRLWTIYRRSQRELEREKIFHDNRIGVYENHPNPTQLLAERTAEISFGVHEAWEALVPDTGSLKGLVGETPKTRVEKTSQ